ncbi:MAG TPA: hypothetical protein VNW52_06415, partial [Burkholderiaceae bacterium]|nr:hypothetical protein [Burkholderiaceae bacterium]
AASQEQSTGIEEVNRAITQMDEVTQQNAALVEQAAAAAGSMQEQARTLMAEVSIFRLSPDAHRSVAVATSNKVAAARPSSGGGFKKPAPRAIANRPAAPKVSAPTKAISTGADNADWEEF